MPFLVKEALALTFIPCACECHTQEGKPSTRVTGKAVASEADLKGIKTLVTGQWFQ